ncbi:MAG: hypothetical protein CVV07_01170 [Gammaproteobacteria bacterium HGW-Gammaproteobacteria-11]|nr:MAG: hypothetical protein CVV07_01170 [Gammaproteobacteria bacterium HGW-Gammaproteobacteria-11]
MSLATLKKRYRAALNGCITAQDRRREIPGSPATFDERFMWSCIANRCRNEYRRIERQIKQQEASA